MIVRTLVIVSFVFSMTPAFSQTQKKCACCQPQYRQFDFWLGDWAVTNPAGKPAGESSIVLLQDSCVIQESWVSANGGYTGTSYNFFDGTLKKWRQVWVDNQGSSIDLEGEFTNGTMVLLAKERINKKGEKYIDRITWTSLADGTVRQHWQQTVDGGKEWKTLFDGTYKKKS